MGIRFDDIFGHRRASAQGMAGSGFKTVKRGTLPANAPPGPRAKPSSGMPQPYAKPPVVPAASGPVAAARHRWPLAAIGSLVFATTGLYYTIRELHHPSDTMGRATPLVAIAIALAAWNRFSRSRR